MADSPTDKGGSQGAGTPADKGDLQGPRSAGDKGDLHDLRPAGDKGDLQGLKAPADKGDSQNLKSAGLKATLPRLKILNLFENSNVRHLTAEDVYKMLLNEGMDIGLATVYRVLTQFETAGLLVRHHFESGKAVFELNQGGHHDHLVCMQCGHVEEFYDPEIEKRQDKIAQARGFNIQEHSLYLYATCTKANCPHRGHQ